MEVGSRVDEDWYCPRGPRDEEERSGSNRKKSSKLRSTKSRSSKFGSDKSGGIRNKYSGMGRNRSNMRSIKFGGMGRKDKFGSLESISAGQIVKATMGSTAGSFATSMAVWTAPISGD